ncbi:MAG: ATP-binding cassette domain-containing protein [Planctomycetes bacterium]|nr:ATP-binding cassette domain-containing protein [Planctomycetota bacterium]
MHGSPSSRKRYSQFLAQRRTRVHLDEEGRVIDDLPADRRAKRRRYLRQYIEWLRPFLSGLIFIFILAVASALLSMIRPVLTQQIIDHAVLADHLDAATKIWRLNVFGSAIIVTILIAQALDSWRNIRMSVLNMAIIHRLRQRLFDHMLELPLAVLHNTKQGGVTSRLSGDVDSVTRLLNLVIVSPGVAIVQVIVALAIIFAWNWRLALAATLCVPPLIFIHMAWVRRIRPIYRSMRRDREEVDGRVVESFGGIRVVRAFRREAHERHDYAAGHHTVVRKTLLARVLETLVGAGWGVMMPVISIVVVWYGGYLVIRDAGTGAASPTTIGQIFAFQWYAFFLLGPVLRIVESMSETQQSLAALERVFDLLAEPVDKPDAEDAVPAPRQVRELRFDHVWFGYDPDRPVIRDFDLHVTGGSVIALVGSSGAGKTTITDLVARFQDPTRGAIACNGIDLRRFKLETYRQLLGVVQQDVFLFDGTVAQNIAYGRRGATDEQIIDAARRANADAFIRDLPQGYETIIGERGVKLSGGQRQRLSVARAFLADPQILILDEATSNLDTESEQLIQAAMTDLLRGRTTFVIAHRLSTVTHADMIVVMDAGEIVERGTHEELIKKSGLYTQMVQRQREAFDIDTIENPA